MGGKKLIAVSAFFLGAVLTFAGCASTKFADEPKDTVSTLIIGQIRLTNRGIPPVLDAEKTYTDRIEVHVRKEPAGEEFVLYSVGTDGYFYLAAESGTYRLTKVALTTGQRTPHEPISFIWTFVRPFEVGSGVTFQVEENKVNNLGVLESACDFTSESPSHTSGLSRGTGFSGDDSDTHTLAAGGYAEVAAWFSKRYPESGWVDREWVDTNLVGGGGEDIAGTRWTGANAEYWEKRGM